MRVLIIEPEHRPRAWLRAELIERGYDTVGAASVRGALHYGGRSAGRDRVALIFVDQDALSDRGGRLFLFVREKLGNPPAILLARPTVSSPGGEWARVLFRPISVGEIAEALQAAIAQSPAAIASER